MFINHKGERHASYHGMWSILVEAGSYYLTTKSNHMKKGSFILASLLLSLTTWAYISPTLPPTTDLKKTEGQHHINLRIDGSTIIPVCYEPIEFTGGLLLRGTFVENKNNTFYDLDISSQGLSGIGASGKKYQANVKATANGHFSDINDHKKVEFKVRVLLTQQGSGRILAATLKFFVVVSANGENYNLEPSTVYLDFGDCIPD